ncbi:MAG: type II toxin-antitoxin system Phd/YefM family antitoxin [Candidatus Gottesmanbacteria bacterium]|nr:type II toxin-antitoxin system Phd/YefM family antitoxin [Candidatus Gottesmanbacteria bacterium]
MMQLIPIKETRANLADLINQVAVGGTSFIITKFGKPKAMLVPVITDKRRQTGLSASFGIWKDREDMKDPDKWVRKIRAQFNRTYD